VSPNVRGFGTCRVSPRPCQVLPVIAIAGCSRVPQIRWGSMPQPLSEGVPPGSRGSAPFAVRFTSGVLAWLRVWGKTELRIVMTTPMVWWKERHSQQSVDMIELEG
jgi:hypothetical protein